MSALSPINRALNQIPKRAEKQEGPQLHETFVDSGVIDVISTVDHQVLYGRRGTGKTHAFSYLGSEASARGDLALNLDLRTVGSANGLLETATLSIPERAARLLVDLLGQLHESLLLAVLNDEVLVSDDQFVARADRLLNTITSVRVTGEVERVRENEHKLADAGGSTMSVKVFPVPSLEAGLTGQSSTEDRGLHRETRRGSEQQSLNFSDVARALRDLANSLSTRRVWILLDEWSSLPRDLQPYLAEFLTRCVLPLQRFTVKIAAIEQQSIFRTDVGGHLIGFELGADMGDINLDHFLVYEGNESQARDFFQDLFFKHLTTNFLESSETPVLVDSSDVVRFGFTDNRAFDELVRAAEGVPRDALHIAARAARKAGQGKISVPLVREATHSWYQNDKFSALASLTQAQALLEWIIVNVIRNKRARAFLVKASHARDGLLMTLFDARVLHIVRRGYSAQDRPGERFDIWGIDYGAYVDLIQTQNAPAGMLPFENDNGTTSYVGIDVPFQDHRAIRRAVLDLQDFYASQPTT